MITASQLNRLLACPASTVLPQCTSTSPYSRAGDARHAYLRDLATMGAADAMARVPEEHRTACEEIDLGSMPVDIRDCRAEVSFAFDISTGKGREIGINLGRSYGTLAPFEIAGTADLVGLIEDEATNRRIVYIADYKGHEEVPTPRQNAQLVFLALAACRAYDVGSAIIEIIYLRGDRVHTVCDSVDEFDFIDFHGRLRAMHLQVEDMRKTVLKDCQVYATQPDVSEGPWCKYCPAFPHCPAKRLLAVELGAGALEPHTDGALTRTLAPAIYHKIKQARAILKRIEATIHAMAEEEPIDLGDGRMLGIVTSPGNERLDGDIAYATIVSLVGASMAEAACERSVTKASIKRALKDATCGDGLPRTERKILDAIRAAGGAHRIQSSKVTEYGTTRGEDTK